MEQGQDAVFTEHDVDLNTINTHGDRVVESRERILRSHSPCTAVGKGHREFLFNFADGILRAVGGGGICCRSRRQLQQKQESKEQNWESFPHSFFLQCIIYHYNYTNK